MDPTTNSGVGDVPDNSASAGTLEGLPEGFVPDGDLDPEVTEASEVTEESTIISDTAEADEEESAEEISEDLNLEMESVIEASPNDSALIKKLRDLVKVKYEDYSARVQPELSTNQQEAIELVNGLFEFDVDTGSPTTRNFAQKIAQKDIALAEQAFQDLSDVAVDANGFTLGHKFLEKIGLDPWKIEELRQFSRGEINPSDHGIIEVHDKVPKEYREAYKALDDVTRTDVDIYLDAETDAQTQSAMRTLRNQKISMDNEKQREEYQTVAQERFNTEVFTALEQDLDVTYTGVLTSLKSNPAYNKVAISADKNIDSMVKDTVIANLNALGDPKSVIGKQAVANFEARGVKVDVPQVSALMKTIEDSSKVAITAERMGKAQGRDYTTQIQDALARKSEAVSKLVALGNKYFSQTLVNLTGASTNTPAPKAGLPNMDSGAKLAPTRTPGVKTMAELDKEILGIAKALQAGQ